MLYTLFDQDYSEPVDRQKEPAGSRDNLIHKLKQRIQERDRALEVHKHTYTNYFTKQVLNRSNKLAVCLL